MIGDYLQEFTYEYLLSKSLVRISDDYDKRQGAIMWDAIAPHAYQLAEFYLQLKEVYRNTYADSATGEYLDLRVKEQGMARYQATYALKRADFADESGSPISVPVGTRFTTVSASVPVNYYVESAYIDEEGKTVSGAYALRCELAGITGNDYTGELINITFISGIATATMSTLLEPAQNQETDDELRTRYYLRLSQKPFGGNIAQYDEEIRALDGVGEVQVYPVWNGGGTVKLSVVDAEYNPISTEFIANLDKLIDPENVNGDKGTGLGMAPIGHVVTVTTPTEVTIDVKATIAVTGGVTLGQIQSSVREAIQYYFDELRVNWGMADELNNYHVTVYVARIIANILRVSGVANVTNVTLNDSANDMELLETAAVQQLPKLGTVLLTPQS